MTQAEFNIRLYLSGAMARLVKLVEAHQDKATPQRKLYDSMEQLFNSLNDEVLAFIRLRYMEQLTLDEIAKLTGLSRSQVHTRTHKVLQSVRDLLADIE